MSSRMLQYALAIDPDTPSDAYECLATTFQCTVTCNPSKSSSLKEARPSAIEAAAALISQALLKGAQAHSKREHGNESIPYLHGQQQSHMVLLRN